MQLNRILPVFIICLTILVSFYFVSRSNIYIKQTGGIDNNGKISNTLTVSGDGKVYVKPDMAVINISFSEIAPTSKEALTKVNDKIALAIKTAKQNNIQDNDISTTGLDIYTEYDYSTTVRKITGQRATQALSIKIRKLEDSALKASTLIDALSGIDNIQMNGISFDIEDKSKYFAQARELAFSKAQQKATQLAQLAHVSLLKPVSITDTDYDIASPITYTNKAELNMAFGGGRSSSIPTGEMSVSINLSVLWGIE
jgi:uncharacterized protein